MNPQNSLPLPCTLTTHLFLVRERWKSTTIYQVNQPTNVIPFTRVRVWTVVGKAVCGAAMPDGVLLQVAENLWHEHVCKAEPVS